MPAGLVPAGNGTAGYHGLHWNRRSFYVRCDRGGARLAEAVSRAYAAGLDDYHLEPMVLTENGVPVGRIRDETPWYSAAAGESGRWS